MKVITYEINGKTRTRGFKDTDLHSLTNNRQITIIAVRDLAPVPPGHGVSRLLAWVREKCGS